MSERSRNNFVRASGAPRTLAARRIFPDPGSFDIAAIIRGVLWRLLMMQVEQQ
jgi:hypothetical protein